MRNLSFSKILLVLFLLGSGSGVLVSAIGLWSIEQSARQIDWLHNIDMVNLKQASKMAMLLSRMQSQANDILGGMQPIAAGMDGLDQDDAIIRGYIDHLKKNLRRGHNQHQIHEFARHYALLPTSQRQAFAWLDTDTEEARRLFMEQTKPLYEQAIDFAEDFVPNIMQSANLIYQEAAESRHQNKQALLTAAVLSGILFTLCAGVGRRFVVVNEQNEQSLRLAAAVFDSSSEGIIITAPSGRILRVNPAFTALTGYQPEDVIGQNPRMFGSGQHDAEFYQMLWNALLNNGHWQGEIWNRRKNGEQYPEWLSISSIRLPSGQIDYFVAIFSDITERKCAQDKIIHQAYHDVLTNLPNRVLFKDRLEQSLTFAHRLKHKKVALLFIDLDRFKLINDSLGHGAGDQLLQLVSQRLREIMRESDTLARLGGDEFTILLPDVDCTEDAMLVANKVLAALKYHFHIDGHDIFVSASIGISMYPDDGTDVDTLMKHADAAMYRVKEQGRAGFQVYTGALNRHSLRRLDLEHDLHKALEKNQLVLHYQPQFDLAQGGIRGVEALIRWQHPELGMISPVEFIPIAEETGMIAPIGAWVLDTACKQAFAWKKAGFPDLVMSVNLSVRQFLQQDIVGLVTQTIQECGLGAHILELEITESVAMEDVAYTIKTLELLVATGLKMAIDDFGTGYSSLSQLKKMPVGILKIDRSFVQDITTDPDDAAIVSAVITMAHRLGLKVIAEGVETEAQLAHLREQRCDFVQGFLFARPLPADELEILLARTLHSLADCSVAEAENAPRQVSMARQ